MTVDSTDAIANQDHLAVAREILRQGIILLESIDSAAYIQPVPEAFDSTIGAHYRHCLDHFQCLVAGAAEQCVDYDRRARDPIIETDLFAALRRTRELLERIELLAEQDSPASKVRVRSGLSYRNAAPQEAESTLGREWMYVVAHAMHHFALIRVMARLLRVDLPESFGFAPSTLHHRNRAGSGEATTALKRE